MPLSLVSNDQRPEVIVDNASPGFSTTGSWGTSSSGCGCYGTNYRVHDPQAPTGTIIVDDSDVTSTTSSGNWFVGAGAADQYGLTYHSAWGKTGFFNPLHLSATFQWSPNLPSAGRYAVYARWPVPDTVNDSEYAVYGVYHRYGIGYNAFDQRASGGQWWLIGRFEFAAGQAIIQMGNDSYGNNIADAIRMVPLGTPTAPTFDQARWAAPDAQTYTVYARWPASSENSPDAIYTVTHAGGSTEVEENQQGSGGAWKSLGTFTFTSASGQGVSLSADPDHKVVADAVRFVPAGSSVYKEQTGFYHLDQLNTPQKLTNASKTVIWDASYEPFGRATTLTTSIPQPLRFPGQYFDAEKPWAIQLCPAFGS